MTTRKLRQKKKKTARRPLVRNLTFSAQLVMKVISDRNKTDPVTSLKKKKKLSATRHFKFEQEWGKWSWKKQEIGNQKSERRKHLAGAQARKAVFRPTPGRKEGILVAPAFLNTHGIRQNIRTGRQQRVCTEAAVNHYTYGSCVPLLLASSTRSSHSQSCIVYMGVAGARAFWLVLWFNPQRTIALVGSATLSPVQTRSWLQEAFVIGRNDF